MAYSILGGTHCVDMAAITAVYMASWEMAGQSKGSQEGNKKRWKQANRLHILTTLNHIPAAPPGAGTTSSEDMPGVTPLLALRVCTSPQYLSRKDTYLTIHGREFCLLKEGMYRHRKYMYWHPTIVNSIMCLRWYYLVFSARNGTSIERNIQLWDTNICEENQRKRKMRKEGPLGKSVLRRSFVATSKRSLLYNDTSQTRKKTHRI